MFDSTYSTQAKKYFHTIKCVKEKYLQTPGKQKSEDSLPDTAAIKAISQNHKTLSPQRGPQRKADLTEYMRVIVLRITSQQFSFINQDGGSGCENRCWLNYGEEVKDKHGLLVQR